MAELSERLLVVDNTGGVDRIFDLADRVLAGAGTAIVRATHQVEPRDPLATD